MNVLPSRSAAQLFLLLISILLRGKTPSLKPINKRLRFRLFPLKITFIIAKQLYQL